MIVEGHPRGVLVTPAIAAAVATLLRLGAREVEHRDGLRVPEHLRRFVAELDALAREHAAACQAIPRSRDAEPERAQREHHAERPAS